MRNVLIFSIFLLLIASCTIRKNDNNLTDLNNLKLNGKVKSTHIKYYHATEKFGKILKGEKYEKYNKNAEQIEIFSETGFLVNSQTFDMYGGLSSVSKFDGKGNEIERREFNTNDGSTISKRVSEYDNSKIITDIFYDNFNGIKSKYQYLYDKEGFLVEENKYVKYNNLESKILYKNNDRGNKILENKYKSDGSLDEKNVFLYDGNDNLIEETNYEKSGKRSSTIKYRYDNKGNMTFEESLYHEDYTGTTKEYKYDSNGNIVEKKNYATIGVDSLSPVKHVGFLMVSNGNTLRRSIYKYDSNDNEILELEYINRTLSGASGHSYEYDERGNWIICVDYKYDINHPDYLVEREMEYYQ